MSINTNFPKICKHISNEPGATPISYYLKFVNHFLWHFYGKLATAVLASHTWITNRQRGLCLGTVSHKACLAHEIHFHIKYYMACDLLKTPESIHLVLPDLFRGTFRNVFVCYLYFSHFLVQCITPESVAIDVVEMQSLFDILG